MDPDDPKVTVVIPCYNHGQNLENAVHSALAQTYPALEIIVVDDGSTEPFTRDLLHTYERPRTKLLSIPHQGPSVARNTGIAQARGEYILPLDADDWISPQYVDRAASVLDREPRVGIVYCDAELVENGRHRRWNLPAYSFPEILLSNSIFATAMFRKRDWEAAGGYNPNMAEGWEDYDFWLSLIERGAEVHKIPNVLFFYRQNHASRNAALGTELYTKLSHQIFQNHPNLYAQNAEFLYRQVVGARHSGALTLAMFLQRFPRLQAGLRWIFHHLPARLHRLARP